MSIRNFIYYTSIIISILSIISIFLAIKNKDKKINKYIIIGDIIFILYLFVISLLLQNLLPIIVNLSILIIWFISFVGEFLYNYYNKIFLPKNVKEINKNELQKLGYKIIIDDDYMSVYKANDLIHKKSINKKYFNIDLEAIYYSN